MSAYQPYIPEGFDEFWRETVEEVESFPIDYKRGWVNDYRLSGFKVEVLSFSVLGGRRLNGWIAVPEAGSRHLAGAEASGGEKHTRLPAFLWTPPYGRESLLPNEYGTREGFVSLSFNFFGEAAFHQEKYRIERGYFTEGADDPHTWVFRRMFQDAYVAFRVLQSQHEVDPDRCSAMGMSQGAGISVWLGAWCKGVRAVCADMVFLCAIKQTLLGSVRRYPLKELTDFMAHIPLGEERVLNTVSYFDTMNVATRCRVPTHVTLGLRDPAARPDNVRSMYAALASREKALTELDWGHDWHPSMVERNRAWMLKSL